MSVEQSLEETILDYQRRFALGTSHTAKAKRYDLQYFLLTAKEISEYPKPLLSDFTSSLVEIFIEKRLQQGEKPSTVSRRLATVKHLARIIAEERTDFLNPCRQIKNTSPTVERPKALAITEMHELESKLLDSLKENYHMLLLEIDNTKLREKLFKKLRNSTLISCFIGTGLRSDELRVLRCDQVSDDIQWLINVRTKGRKFRKVYLPKQLQEPLKNYLELRTRYLQESLLTSYSPSIDRQLPLFVSIYKATLKDLTSYRLNPKTIWQIVRTHSLSTTLHPHLLRHTFATDLLDSSNDIRLVAQALGHSDVRVTMKYTERTDDAVAEAIERKNSGIKQIFPVTKN
jgi:integrase/recombinase XerC